MFLLVVRYVLLALAVRASAYGFSLIACSCCFILSRGKEGNEGGRRGVIVRGGWFWLLVGMLWAGYAFLGRFCV